MRIFVMVISSYFNMNENLYQARRLGGGGVRGVRTNPPPLPGKVRSVAYSKII